MGLRGRVLGRPADVVQTGDLQVTTLESTCLAPGRGRAGQEMLERSRAKHREKVA